MSTTKEMKKSVDKHAESMLEIWLNLHIRVQRELQNYKDPVLQERARIEQQNHKHPVNQSW